MLSQLEFKLNVEEQYLKGIEKMVQLYGMEGDRKSKADAAARRVESKQKIVLLKQALKRYEELHVDVESADAQDGMRKTRSQMLVKLRLLTKPQMIPLICRTCESLSADSLVFGSSLSGMLTTLRLGDSHAAQRRLWPLRSKTPSLREQEHPVMTDGKQRFTISRSTRPMKLSSPSTTNQPNTPCLLACCGFVFQTS